MKIPQWLNFRTGAALSVVFAIIVTSIVLSYKQEEAPGETAPAPLAKNLDVPFTSQAPQGDWSEPWQNACEETSIIMATNFYKDIGITPEQAKKQILDVFAAKDKKFGQSKDESMERIAEIVNAAQLGWTATVSVNPELNAIKEEIMANRPVIVPVNEKLLASSPLADSVEYHVMVISGYDDKSEEFIVQDPGTTSGKNNRYGYENFYKAINDYLTGSSPSGRRAVIFTKPD